MDEPVCVSPVKLDQAIYIMIRAHCAPRPYPCCASVTANYVRERVAVTGEGKSPI